MRREYFFSVAVAGAVLLSSRVATAQPVHEAELGPGVGLTVYNQNFAIIKQRRVMKLPRGRSVVKFAEVAATIVPETVQFESLRPPGGARVIEQDYEFDLLSADKLLDKYVDRRIGLVSRDGVLIEGKLLAFDGGQVVLSTDRGIEMVPRGKNIKDIRFSSLPEGLLTKPTLIWLIEAAQGGEHLVKVAYRANKMSWRVDYRARCDADGARLDLAGWVTITNNSGATFKDARLKLMAGDVHVVKQPRPLEPMRERGMRVAARPAGGRGFVEKTFAEYHLYTLGRPATLKDRQTKQIELINVPGVPVKRKYISRPDWGQKVGVVLEFKNDEKVREGLGIPLPKGPIRVFQMDADRQFEFIGKDGIDHTPKKEDVKIRIGYVFDIVAERRQLAERRPSRRTSEKDWRIRLRNHKDRPVTVEVIEPLEGWANWKVLKRSQAYRKKDFRTIVFDVKVPADAERVVTYTVRYQW